MTFTPPTFIKLRTDTLNLDIDFSTLIGRYAIAPSASPLVASSSSSTPVVKSNSLETLIARTHDVITCSSDRATAKEVFLLLNQECRDILAEKNEPKIKKGTLILLGALLHRYFRLLKKYDKSNSYTSYFWTPYDERNCGLFKAIRKALNLPDEMPKDYRQRDLAILDVTTIVSTLKAFRDHMKLGDRYLNYPHFATDKNFEPYLNEIIQEHSSRGSDVIKQFKAISFIQSLARQVESSVVQNEEALTSWCSKLAKKHDDYSTLTVELIEQHLRENMEPGITRENILDLLDTPEIKNKILSLDHPQLLCALKKCNADLASHIMTGGYALLLQTKQINDKLAFYMEKALGLHQPHSADEVAPVFADTDMLSGIAFLKQFLTNNPGTVLDCEFFGDRSQANTFIAQVEQRLSTKPKEMMPESASLTV